MLTEASGAVWLSLGASRLPTGTPLKSPDAGPAAGGYHSLEPEVAKPGKQGAPCLEPFPFRAIAPGPSGLSLAAARAVGRYRHSAPRSYSSDPLYFCLPCLPVPVALHRLHCQTTTASSFESSSSFRLSLSSRFVSSFFNPSAFSPCSLSLSLLITFPKVLFAALQVHRVLLPPCSTSLQKVSTAPTTTSACSACSACSRFN